MLPYFSTSRGDLYNNDCFDVMKTLEDKSVDLILCDLPYGVTARNDWDIKLPPEQLWAEYNRIIKDNGVIALTATMPFGAELILQNKKNFRYDLIWQKTTSTGFLNANKMPLRSHESILIFYKKLPTYNPQYTECKPYKSKASTRFQETASLNYRKQKPWVSVNDGTKGRPKSVITFRKDKDRVHPTQKPVELFKYMINTYTNPGDLVLDNCAGVGTTAIAADITDRRWICIELEKKYCDLTIQRFAELSTT